MVTTDKYPKMYKFQLLKYTYFSVPRHQPEPEHAEQLSGGRRVCWHALLQPTGGSEDGLHSSVYIVTVTEQQPVHHDGQQPGPHHPHLPRLRQGPQPECRLQVTKSHSAL